LPLSIKLSLQTGKQTEGVFMPVKKILIVDDSPTASSRISF